MENHILNSDFSLSEVRVLHEIDKNDKFTSKMLSEILCIDTGYLSRMLKKFEGLGLVIRKNQQMINELSIYILQKKDRKLWMD